MSKICKDITALVNTLEQHRFPYSEDNIPKDGIYVLFQDGENAHGCKRIVRVGTHTGTHQLRSRLKQHFLAKNKDRSIFRKNIGRALLNKRNDPFLDQWEIDLTTRKNKDLFQGLINLDYQKLVEDEVSEYIKDNFTFAVFQVGKREDRLDIESKLISTVSLCQECFPSKKWLGNNSPKKKIAESGLWQVNELYKTTFNFSDLQSFMKLIINQ